MKKLLCVCLALLMLTPAFSWAQTVTGMGGLVTPPSTAQSEVSPAPSAEPDLSTEAPSPLIDVPSDAPGTSGAVGTAPVWADNAELIAAFLDGEGLIHERENYEGISEDFYLTVSTQSTVNTMSCLIEAYSDFITLFINYPLTVPENRVEDVAVFLSLVNINILTGSFQMNTQNRSIIFYNGLPSYANLPLDVLSTAYYQAVSSMETYADALAKVILTDTDPYDAYNEMQSAM